jgi:hypothetical protein
MPPGSKLCRRRDSATADALRAIRDFDLTELEALEPPCGLGRD